MKYRSLSLVLPCYNLEKTIYQNIRVVHGYLQSHFEQYQIIAVNDGSRDKTSIELEKAVRDFGITVVNYAQNQGKGYAVRQGVARAECEIVGFLDADLIIPMEELLAFIKSIENGYDVAIASRLRPGGKVLIPVLHHRLLLEKAFRYLRILIIGVARVRDTQCGCKFFTKKVAEEIFPLMRINRFSFDAEFIFLAHQKQYRIEEIPITLQNPTSSSVRILRDSLLMLRDLFRIRWFAIRGYYTMVLMEEAWWQNLNCEITFDDFGISPKANEHILTLTALLPKIRVAVMMNGRFSQAEKDQLIASQAALDIHLDRETTLMLLPKMSFAKRVIRFLQSKKQSQDVGAIWRQQLQEFHAVFGKYPERLTTHEHVHFFSGYFREFVAIARELGVKRIRFGSQYSSHYTLVAFVLNFLRLWNQGIFRKSGLQTTQYLLSWDWVASRKKPQEEIENYLQRGSTEIIFHPERDEEFIFLKKLTS